MSLDAVRARRHALMLSRIAEERVRKIRRGRAVQRVRRTESLVIRDSDDAAAGSPAVVTRLSGSIPTLGFYDLDGGYPDDVIDRIVHVAGPVLVADAFGPDDVGRDGSIIITRVTEVPE